MRNVLSIVTVGLAMMLIATGTNCSPAAPKVGGNPEVQRTTDEQSAKKALSGHKHEAEFKTAAANEDPSRWEGAGHLSVNKTVHDFGQIDPRSKVKGNFILTNDGDKELTIKKIGKSCGCTVPSIKTKTLKPGESVALSITFTAPAKPGPVMKKLWVITEEPSLPKKLTMAVKAEVKKSVVTDPEQLSFELRKSSNNEVELVMESVENKPFKIIGYSSPREALELIFDPDSRAVKHTLSVKGDPAKLRQSPNGVLTVNITHPKSNSITIPYRAIKPFVSHPATRRFRNITPGQEEKVEIEVVSNFGESFQLGEVRSEKGLVKVLSITENKEGYQLLVQMTAPKEGKKSMIRDHLLIDIKDYPEDTVKILCYSMVK